MKDGSAYAFDLAPTVAKTNKSEEEPVHDFARLEKSRFTKITFAQSPCPYMGITSSDLHSLAYRQINLSREYNRKELLPSSQCVFEVGLEEHHMKGRDVINKQMKQLYTTLMYTEYFTSWQSLHPEQITDFCNAYRNRLEDPGFLLHTRYFESTTDADFLCFYWDLWLNNGAHTADFFRGKVIEPSGTVHAYEPLKTWGRFCAIEGLALTQRELDRLWSQRVGVLVCQQPQPFSQTPKAKLEKSVNLLGFAEKHTAKALTSMLLASARQLNHNGTIVFDVPIKNVSLSRLQMLGYPSYPDAAIYRTAGKAVKAVHEIVNSLNSELRHDAAQAGTKPAYLDIRELRILTFGVWGDTDAFVVLRKYV